MVGTRDDYERTATAVAWRVAALVAFVAWIATGSFMIGLAWGVLCIPLPWMLTYFTRHP